MIPMQNIVGNRVRLARSLRKPKLTQIELATQLQLLDWQIDRGGVAKIESGIRQVTDIEVVKLAKALQIKPGWLLEGEDNTP
ncbi:MAG: helix-turn-helix transcriptional regulator [Anaerolineales bacterium]|nr:helix-turn-helix transcriptional regulator [Anaerolineales bacterium]